MQVLDPGQSEFCPTSHYIHLSRYTLVFMIFKLQNAFVPHDPCTVSIADFIDLLSPLGSKSVLKF